jgi:hypothetical protein
VQREREKVRRQKERMRSRGTSKKKKKKEAKNLPSPEPIELFPGHVLALENVAVLFFGLRSICRMVPLSFDIAEFFFFGGAIVHG